jgi:excinuclease UvrABC ATPase subunit
MILAPALTARSSVLREELPRLRQRGFQRVRIAGVVKNLDDFDVLPAGVGAAELVVELVIDRLVAVADQRSRLADSLELAFREGKDRVLILAQKSADAPWRELSLSQSLACEVCGDVFEKLTPRHFSFNHSEGACGSCGGLGRKLPPALFELVFIDGPVTLPPLLLEANEAAAAAAPPPGRHLAWFTYNSAPEDAARTREDTLSPDAREYLRWPEARAAK